MNQIGVGRAILQRNPSDSQYAGGIMAKALTMGERFSMRHLVPLE
jgi:hypothetical protein